MALNSTLFTGLSGLNVNQTRLNVVGNNIANVNTTAFKSSRVLFRSQFYVTDIPGAPPDGEFGGQNPSQRGLGAAVSAIERDLAPGSIENTGRPTDMAIEGEGYFIVKGQEQGFTRDGAFSLNADNELVTQSGHYLQGYGVDDNEQIVTGQVGNLQIPLGALTKAKATTNVTLQGNLNADGDVASGASILNSNAFTTAAGTQPDLTTALVDLRDPADLVTPLFSDGSTLSVNPRRGGRDLAQLDYTIDATSTLADLANYFGQAMQIDGTMTTTPPPGVTLDSIAGDAATTRRLMIVGNYGTGSALGFDTNGFTNDSADPGLTISEGEYSDGTVSNPTGESVFTSMVLYDSLGTALSANLTVNLESKSDTGTVWRWFATSPNDSDAAAFNPADATHPGAKLATGTISFDSAGSLLNTEANTIAVDRTGTGAELLEFDLDFSLLSSLTSSDSDLVVLRQDGASIGTLTDFSVGTTGQIIGTFDNGLTGTLGQVALATFKNPQGLIDQGGGIFIPSNNAGLPVIGAPLEFGAGGIRGASLELSNTDLSEEFINLIVSSTGFSAASRVISTADQLLSELLNSVR